MSDGIHCLVFSKDRAMQLDAFLRSAKEHAPYATVTVLAAANVCSEDDRQYRLCYAEHAEAAWWWESEFEYLVRLFLDCRERVVFHTDDDVFFRANYYLAQMYGVSSFRLGLNTTYSHPCSRTQAVPNRNITPSTRFIAWRWAEQDGDFGYPLSLNGTVYRSADLLPLLDFPFTNPTELEAGLAARADRFGPQWMTAPLHSCCVSLPHNRVSVSSGCPAGSNPAWQPEALREAYLAGWRIDTEAMDFSNVIGAHQEIPLKFRRLQAR